MELSATYVYKVYQEKSFSAAAKALFVSQPALSASVARLERELGFKIFDRSTVPLTLTPAGRIYIDSLEEISESENHMYRRIRQLSNMKSERLSIGASSHTAQYLLPVICKEFYRRYPDIQVRVDMGNSKNITSLHDELSQNSIDLLISYSFDPQENRATLLIEERLIIAMHKDLAGAGDLQKHSVTREELISRTYSPEKEIEDFSIFKGIRFLRFRKGSLSYQHMAKIIGDYAAASYTIENISNTGLHYNMMAAGLGALLASDTIVATSAINSENILYFVPKCPESYRKVYILSKLEGLEKLAAKKFVETASEVCSSHNVLKLLF